jgi:intraflagellar transport protein 46
MPDVELLMQEWPPEVEDLLHSVGLPSAELDVQLKHFVSICCAVLDIPVHGSKIEALHLLFSLYVEFKQSQGFRSKDDPPPEAAPETTEIMQI